MSRGDVAGPIAVLAVLILLGAAAQLWFSARPPSVQEQVARLTRSAVPNRSTSVLGGDSTEGSDQRWWHRRLIGWTSPDRDVAIHLATVVDDRSVEAFRRSQLSVAGVAALVGALIAVWRLDAGLGGLGLGTLVLPAGGFLAAAWGYDAQLRWRSGHDRGVLDAQLPDAMELVAFLVASGVALGAAIPIVADRSPDPLRRHLQLVVGDMRSGLSLSQALIRLAQRVPSASVKRSTHALITAHDKGTPLSSVARAQAADARAEGHRHLMRQASRREIFALVPVVFLLMPIVVVVALYPAVLSISVQVM